MKDLSSINLEGFTVSAISYNDAYNFFDITILKSELTKWMEANSTILNRTSFNGTWGSGQSETIRIWVNDKVDSLSDYQIRRNEEFLASHKLHEKLGITTNTFFNALSEKLKTLDIGGCAGETSINKQALSFSFHANKNKANQMLILAKELYPKHFLWIEKTERMGYSIHLTQDEETAKSVGAVLEPVKVTKSTANKPRKKLELTLEEIAKKFNVDVKDLKIKE